MHLPALAAIGPFFAVSQADDCGPWRPLRDLLDAGVLDERVSGVREQLTRLAAAEVEPRVAASTLSLGLFARVVSPALGAAALGMPLPPSTLDDAWWQPADRSPWPLALTGPAAQADPATVVTEVVGPLVDAVAVHCSLSRRVLWGNAASAVFGAAGMIGAARPDLRSTAHALAVDLLASPLAGTGSVRERFVRSSCCLYYRIPGGGYCADCLLTASHR